VWSLSAADEEAPLAAAPSIAPTRPLAKPTPVAEADATRLLYERYAGQLLRYCHYQLGSREEAEDAVQTTFLYAFRGLRRGVVPEVESAWLFTIARNVCLGRRRASGRRRRIEFAHDPQALQDVLPAPERTVELMGVEDALAGLPENQRRAILLREWQGLSYREIGEELELGQAAVETLIFRARRTLAARLEGAEPTRRRRAARAFDVGSALAALKTFLGGAAAKLAAAAAALAITGGAVGILVHSPGPAPQAPLVGGDADLAKVVVEPAVPRVANVDREPRSPRQGSAGAAVSEPAGAPSAAAPAPRADVVETSIVEETSSLVEGSAASLLEDSTAVLDETTATVLEGTTGLLGGAVAGEDLLDLDAAAVLP
jgi:RNA polymerase sigma-70 factor (ECF subfamily)